MAPTHADVRRPVGGRRLSACVVAALLVTGTVGCSSSDGSGDPTPSGSALSSSSTSPTASASPTEALTSPVGSPTAAKRYLALPSGATPVPYRTCLEVAGALTGDIVGEIFRPATRPLQLAGLRTIGGLAELIRPKLTTARKTWLSRGFPASFPVIGLIDEKVHATDQLLRAAQQQDLEAIPPIYRTMQRIDVEYARAAGDNPRLCST